MSQTLGKIWIHAVWSTKDVKPLIQPEIEQEVYQFMIDEFKEQKSILRIINGMPDHVHCLFLLNPQKSTSQVIKQVKGHSSHLINQHDFLNEKFAWQVGYAAFSVSESNIKKVYQYIKNQKIKHRDKSFSDELESFRKLNDIG